jgi:hypothetical protein
VKRSRAIHIRPRRPRRARLPPCARSQRRTPKREAQIDFNIGLVEEKRGHAELWWTDATCKTNGPPKTTATTTFYDPDALRMITISAPATIAGHTITVSAPNCDPVAF